MTDVGSGECSRPATCPSSCSAIVWTSMSEPSVRSGDVSEFSPTSDSSSVPLRRKTLIVSPSTPGGSGPQPMSLNPSIGRLDGGGPGQKPGTSASSDGQRVVVPPKPYLNDDPGTALHVASAFLIPASDE